MMRRKLLLCVPPFVLCMLDQLITLFGQSSEYWKGRYSVANEVNPLFNWLLRQHPLAFEAGIAAWVIVFCSVILSAPRRVAMTISIAIVLGHTWGAATWLSMMPPFGYWITLALFLTSAIIIVITWDRFEHSISKGTGS